MPIEHSSPADLTATPRSRAWNWTFCGVLLAATFVNYADRVVFTQNSTSLINALDTDEQGYGATEGWFNAGCALGLLVFGYLADLISVRWLYPAVVLAWSAAGASAGWANSLSDLAWGRFFLGFFEMGHWPCALRATQRVFRPEQRTWGNSILQSGAAIGQIVTPLLIAQSRSLGPDAWRLSFWAAGALGLPWAVWWLLTVRERDLQQPALQTSDDAGVARPHEELPLWRVFATRRWWVLLCVVLCINTLWHFVRVWMPHLLKKNHGYSEEFADYFTALFYAMTFIGSLAAGWLTSHWPRIGWHVHRARLVTFALCSLLSAAAIPAAFAPRGVLALTFLLLVGLGSLGLFPIYYSLAQEISARHQGKVGASFGFCAWTTMFFVHRETGALLKERADVGAWLLASAGIGPLLACIVLAMFWGKRGENNGR